MLTSGATRWSGHVPTAITRKTGEEGAAALSTATETRKAAQSQPAVFRHTKKSDWGLATLQWERDEKRCFRFEDGTERVFSLEFCHLLEPVDAPPPPGCLAKPKAASAIEPTLKDQVALMLESFPEGFQDPTWLAEHRGVGAPRRVKRHRAATIEQSEKELSAEVCKARLSKRNFAALLEGMCAVLDKTDLVSRAEVDSLRNCEPTERLVTAIHEAIHGEDPIGPRFDRLCRELNSAGAKASSWPLVTAILALGSPREHMCVRPSVLKPQVRAIGRGHRLTATPTPGSYATYLDLARQVRDVLTEAGHPPADFLDVYDFVWFTMRPAARADLQRLADARTRKKAGSGDASEAA